MFIFKRYIISNVLTSFLGVIFTITGLVWLSQIMKLVFLIDRGVGFLGFLYLSILILPSLLFAILPFAITIAVIASYNRLSYERELIILSNSGIDAWNIIKPGLLVAGAVTIFSYFISFYLLPSSTRLLKSNLKHFRSNYVVSLVQEKTFTNISKDIILYVDDKAPGNILKGLIIFDDKDPNRKSVIFAQSGNIDSSGEHPTLNLKTGMKQEIDRDGKLIKLHYDTLSVSLHTEDSCDDTNSDKCNKIIDPLKRDLSELYINELFTLAPPEETQKLKLIAEANQRVIWPLYALALSFLALSIFMSKPYSRRGNADIIYKIALAGIFFIVLHFICYNAASKNIMMNIFCYMNVGLCFLFSYYILNQTLNIKRAK